jgi:hypothetical protein
MDAVLAMTLAVLGARAISLVALGLRLHAQTLRDRHQQAILVSIAAHVPRTGVLEVDHTTGGGHVRLRIVAGHQLERETDGRARTASPTTWRSRRSTDVPSNH